MFHFGNSGRALQMYTLLAAVYMLPYLQAVSTGVISLPLAAEGLSSDQVAMTASAYLGGYALVQAVAGILAARFGPRLTLGLFLALSGFGSLIFANSGQLPQALPMVVIGRIMCGMGMAVVLTSAMTIFVRWFSPESYGRLCGWFFCFGGLGAVFGTAPMALLCEVWGWRGIFAFLGLGTLAASLACVILVRNSPAGAPKSAQNQDFANLFHSLGLVARKFDFWRIAAWFFCISGIYYGFFALWGGPWLSQVHHLEAGQIGGILSMGALGFVFGSPLFTWYCEHTLCSHRLGLCASCATALICMCLFIFVGQYLHVYLLYIIALGLGMACNAPNAIAYASARVLFGGELAGTLGGIFGFFSFLGGMFLQSFGGMIIEAAKTHYSEIASVFQLAFAPFAFFALLGLVLLWGLPETCLDSRQKPLNF